VPSLFRKIKLLEDTAAFKKVELNIHHFMITAGLKDLVQTILPDGLVKWTFGSRYEIAASQNKKDPPESIPVFCMDETMKTRSLFEISKGVFDDPDRTVNKRVSKEELWAPFENIIYIGDGPTDVPALSLVRRQGGLGVAVYNPDKPQSEIDKRFKEMRLDKRADLITPADFSETGELFEYLTVRCKQICQRYRAELAV
jgi:hypothetical protein